MEKVRNAFNKEQYKEFTDKLFILIPKAKSIAVDANGQCHWFYDNCYSTNESWWGCYQPKYYLGDILLIDFNWRDTCAIRQKETT